MVVSKTAEAAVVYGEAAGVFLAMKGDGSWAGKCNRFGEINELRSKQDYEDRMDHLL